MPNNEPAAVPKNNPIPFAPVPTGVCFWPVRTSDSSKRVVSFLGADSTVVGSESRRFLAMREDGSRYHGDSQQRPFAGFLAFLAGHQFKFAPAFDVLSQSPQSGFGST